MSNLVATMEKPLDLDDSFELDIQEIKEVLEQQEPTATGLTCTLFTCPALTCGSSCTSC